MGRLHCIPRPPTQGTILTRKVRAWTLTGSAGYTGREGDCGTTTRYSGLLTASTMLEPFAAFGRASKGYRGLCECIWFARGGS